MDLRSLSLHNRAVGVIVAGIMALVASPAVHAATASFVQPEGYSAANAAALSGPGNGALELNYGSPLELVTDTLFATDSSNDDVAVFTLDVLGRGAAVGRVEIGYIDENGNTQLAASQSFRSGRPSNLRSLFYRGCRDFGGCNFIRIFTRNESYDREGVRVDYVTINGEVVHVTAPAPEPALWLLMITGFVIVAARVKQIRRREFAPLRPGGLVVA